MEHLACYSTHAQVAELIAEEFDITLTTRHVRSYDPTSFQFAGSHRWPEYHRLVRDRYRHEIGKIAIAQKAYRLTHLQRLFEKALDSDDCRQAMTVLALAGKEMGNFHVKANAPGSSRR